MKLTDRGSRPERGRKLALYVVALCREVWDDLPWICRTLVEITESAADGEFNVKRLLSPIWNIADWILQSARTGAREARNQPSALYPSGNLVRWESYLGVTKPPDADEHVRNLTAERLYVVCRRIYGLEWPMRNPPRLRRDVHSLPLIRDIAGDPYQPVKFKGEWRTDTVLALARTMYESREFSAMPILADALQDAGCNHDAMLTHCRDTSLTHVRGCWVVDLVLGKE
jgi:hypothetical protein